MEYQENWREVLERSLEWLIGVFFLYYVCSSCHCRSWVQRWDVAFTLSLSKRTFEGCVMYVCMSGLIWPGLSVCLYVCMSVCMHACMYMYRVSDVSIRSINIVSSDGNPMLLVAFLSPCSYNRSVATESHSLFCHQYRIVTKASREIHREYPQLPCIEKCRRT